MTFEIKRVYEPAVPPDGVRVLVDRLWPRGVSKSKAHLDEWMKNVAPSSAAAAVVRPSARALCRIQEALREGTLRQS